MELYFFCPSPSAILQCGRGFGVAHKNSVNVSSRPRSMARRKILGAAITCLVERVVIIPLGRLPTGTGRLPVPPIPPIRPPQMKPVGWLGHPCHHSARQVAERQRQVACAAHFRDAPAHIEHLGGTGNLPVPLGDPPSGRSNAPPSANLSDSHQPGRRIQLPDLRVEIGCSTFCEDRGHAASLVNATLAIAPRTPGVSA